MQSAGKCPTGRLSGCDGKIRAARSVRRGQPAMPEWHRVGCLLRPHRACRPRRYGFLASVYRARCASAIPAARNGPKGRHPESACMTDQTNPSGLTDDEAQEFHKIYVGSLTAFIVVAVIAHFLAWSWRPWIPGANGYVTSALDTVQHITGFLV